MDKYVGVRVMIAFGYVIEELVTVPAHEVVENCAAHVHIHTIDLNIYLI
jgi:hypothetical protein